MAIQTKMTELLGIEQPLLMGPMAWITDAPLVAAVSNAGAAGVLAASGRGADWVHSEVARTRALTNKPFGINVSLKSAPDRDAIVAAIIDEGIDFVTMGAGDPRPDLPKFKAAGITTICIVPNTKLARRVEDAGADLIIIEGMESGGRIGDLSTMALMTNVVPEVSVPVIAAGGIVDGRGMAAALVMGCAGVQMGSRFLLAEECTANPANAQAIIAAHDTDSVTIGWSRHHGLRGLRNAFTEGYRKMEITGEPDDKLSEYVQGISRRVAEQGQGSDEMNGLIQVGEGLEPLTRVQPAAEIVAEIMEETERVLCAAPELVD